MSHDLLRKYMAHVLAQEGRVYLHGYIVDADDDRPAPFTEAELATLREIAMGLPKREGVSVDGTDYHWQRVKP